MTVCAPVDGDPAIMAPLVALAAVGLEEQALNLHDAVNALWMRCCAPGLPGLAAQQGMHAAIAIGRQIGDERADVGKQLGVGQRRSPSWPGRRSVVHGRQVLAADTDSVGNRGHRTPPATR